jgi:hypothetical protein
MLKVRDEVCVVRINPYPQTGPRASFRPGRIAGFYGAKKEG